MILSVSGEHIVGIVNNGSPYMYIHFKDKDGLQTIRIPITEETTKDLITTLKEQHG